MKLPDEQTPDELIEAAYLALRRQLADDLLAQVKQVEPTRFEQIVIDLLLKMGYGSGHLSSGRRIGRSGDGGIDGTISEDRLGLEMIYIQAKRYTEQTVGRPTIQAFVGALAGHRARKGVFITTSKLSQDARAYITGIDARIVLIDGEELAQYMIDFDLGVSRKRTVELKRIDSDYFDGE